MGPIDTAEADHTIVKEVTLRHQHVSTLGSEASGLTTNWVKREMMAAFPYVLKHPQN